jgi:hypothetical protein
MNRLSILLLLLILIAAGSANAAMIEPDNVSLEPTGSSSFVLDISKDGNNLTTLSTFTLPSQFISETDSAPPTSWIVGLGLCLVFFGYKLKNKAD